MMLLKKPMYDKLLTRFNTIDTSGFFFKTQYNTDKSALEKKSMTQITKYLMLVFLLKTDYNVKITEIEGKISSIIGLSTTSTLNILKKRYPTAVI